MEVAYMWLDETTKVVMTVKCHYAKPEIHLLTSPSS